MPIYFKPLRRKIGVVTLLLACLFVAGWVRSCQYLDSLSFRPGDKKIQYVLSLNQQVGLMFFSNNLPQPQFARLDWTSTPLSRIHGFHGHNLGWWWHSHGFGLIEIRGMAGTIEYSGLIVPYWSIALPLTVLSAWLLLSKRRTDCFHSLSENYRSSGNL